MGRIVSITLAVAVFTCIIFTCSCAKEEKEIKIETAPTIKTKYIVTADLTHGAKYIVKGTVLQLDKEKDKTFIFLHSDYIKEQK